MSTTREELTEEIIANARRDRSRLERVADGLVSGFQGRDPVPEDEGDNDIDSEATAAFAEEIASISDSLSRINHELVELVKLERKSELKADPNRLPKHELEDALDEIQPEGTEPVN